MNYVYSTLSSDTRYCSHVIGDDKGAYTIGESVLIKGGANVAKKFKMLSAGGDNGTVPGAVTCVTDAQLELLEACQVFRRQRDRGFITVVKKQAAIEKVTSGMEAKDKSAPKSLDDYEEKDNDDGIKVVVPKVQKRK